MRDWHSARTRVYNIHYDRLRRSHGDPSDDAIPLPGSTDYATLFGVARVKKKDVVNLPESVRQRLLNLATERKQEFGLVLGRYGWNDSYIVSVSAPIAIRLS